MTIQSLNATPLAASPSSATSTSNNTSSSASDNSLDNVNENEFLQLLIAQIKNQDPTNPTDSTAFVTQLAQFSSLEQLVAIRGDMDTLAQGANTSTSTSTSSTTQGGN